MNENLQNALVGVIEKATSGLDASVDFLSAEVPDVVSQLLTWYAVYHSLQFVTGVILLTTLVWVWVKYGGKGDVINPESHTSIGNHKQTLTHDSDGIVCVRIAITGCGSVLLFLICSVDLLNLTWLKIMIAPKLYLIEYAATLVK